MGQRNHWCSGVHSWTGDSPQRPQAWKRLGMMQSGILVFALYFKTNKLVSGQRSDINKKLPR